MDDQFAAQTEGFSMILRGFFNMMWMTLIPLMSMLPLLIVFLFCQRYFIEGTSFGGGKE